MTWKNKAVIWTTGVLTATTLLAGCGAGSRTGAATASKVACDFTKPASATTVNVLAYNSSAVDPFSNTMVSSCSHDDVTVKHDPIDFAGQVQKTQATLGSDTGTYDIIETYSYIIPSLAAAGKLEPLDDLFAKYKDKYGMDAINESMRKRVSYDGKLYALPMQAQTLVMAYRKDIFDKYQLTPPKTFEDLRAAAKKIQDGGDMKYPIALPWLATGDISTAYGAALGSQGKTFADPATKTPTGSSPESKVALEQMKTLLPFMDPQVTTFDQPKVQQQMYNGSAAISIMFSGRMNDLVQEKNSKNFDKIAFAAPPAVLASGKLYTAVSIDAWSIPKNTKIDRDLLFQIVAASVSEDASKSAVPAAYPARNGMVDPAKVPYAKAADESIAGAPTPFPYPWIPAADSAVKPVVAQVMGGQLTVDAGMKQLDDVEKKALAQG